MGVYQLLHTNRPNLVANVKPSIHKQPQTFSVRLFKPPSKPLDKPTDLLEITDYMDDRSQKEPSHESSSWDPLQLIPLSYTYVMTIFSTILVICVSAGIFFLLFKHLKLHALVSTIALTHGRCRCQTHMCGKGCLLKPTLDCLATVVTIVVLLTWLYSHCRHLIWYCQHKYNRTCALYIFFHNIHFYVSVNLKHLSGYMHMYKLENAITPEQMSYHKSFLWDTIYFEWHSTCLHINGQMVNLPSSITIPLKDKIRAKKMLAKEDLDLQFMTKQGSDWCSITKQYRLSISLTLLKLNNLVNFFQMPLSFIFQNRKAY